MKKSFLISTAVLFVITLTSCSPYLIDRAINVTGQYKAIKAKDMPDFDSEYKWIEKSKEEADGIWKNYTAVEKTDYKKLDFYEHTNSNGQEFYSKFIDCPVEKWKNTYYENIPWNYIYTSYTSSKEYELNAESPDTFADNVKIFFAENDNSYTKFVFDSPSEKGLRIYCSGWLVYEDYDSYFENPSEGNEKYRVHSAIVYQQ